MGTQLPLPKGHSPLIFGPCVLWPNGWLDQDVTWYRGRPQPRRHCVRWEPTAPPQKGASPLIFGTCLLWSNGCMNQDVTWYGGRPRPRPHCIRWGSSSAEKGAQHPHFSAELDPHLIQCGLGRGLPPYQVTSWFTQPFGHYRCRLGRDLPPYQVASWFIHRFGHNRHEPEIGGCAPLGGENRVPI